MEGGNVWFKGLVSQSSYKDPDFTVMSKPIWWRRSSRLPPTIWLKSMVKKLFFNFLLTSRISLLYWSRVVVLVTLVRESHTSDLCKFLNREADLSRSTLSKQVIPMTFSDFSPMWKSISWLGRWVKSMAWCHNKFW